MAPISTAGVAAGAGTGVTILVPRRAAWPPRSHELRGVRPAGRPAGRRGDTLIARRVPPHAAIWIAQSKQPDKRKAFDAFERFALAACSNMPTDEILS